MKLVSGIVDSGFFAQSALSAEVATKDSLGRNISETYLTGIDLTPYQTIEGMTAYQSAGEYYSASNPSGFLVANDITGKLDASVYAADSGNFLTGVPDTYLQNTDLSTEDGKVTAISGVPLAAGGGGDVPEGVMVESGLEYNAVNEISGYNGSAIAQYGAEKQWLVHDDTLVHAANSAQYALGCNISALQRLMGIDETVLWTGVPTASTDQIVVSENFSNFDRVRIYWKSYKRHYADEVWAGTDTGFPIVVGAVFGLSDGNYEKSMTIWNCSNGTTYTWASTIHGTFTGTQSKTWNSNVIPMKIVGIGRKQ